MQGLVERQNLLVQTRAHLLSDELRGLEAEFQRLARLADIDLTDQNMEPENRVLSIARKDSTSFSAGIAIATGHETLDSARLAESGLDQRRRSFTISAMLLASVG